MREKAKQEFILQALRYIEGIENNSLSKSHAAHKKLRKICKIQSEAEDKGRQFFSELVTHDEPAVRLAAATFLYLSDPVRAVTEFQFLNTLGITHISLLASSNLWRIQRGLFQIDLD